MGQFDSLIGAANKAIKSARALLETENPPFNVVKCVVRTYAGFSRVIGPSWPSALQHAAPVRHHPGMHPRCSAWSA